jgi:two-component system, chemotaxis family, chemotaxis protein CheY
MTSTGSILLVEDDRAIRESFLEALEDEGYTAVGAIDGVDALDRLHKDGPLPELIVLDLMMPRMNGIELLQELAGEEGWSKIPVLVVTADASARRKAEALGVAGFLKKPVRLNQLFAAVERILADKRGPS